MIFSLVWSVYYGDGGADALLISMLISIAIGVLLFGIGSRKKEELFKKEALVIVGLGWLVATAAGALPFVFSGTLPNFIDAWFESTSGFTTTGSTVLVDIEATARGILFWRSFTHWLGGMGIIVLFVAVLPFLGAGGRQLFRSEVSGPLKETLTPRIKDTAAILWRLYLLFTVVETLLLMIGGMSLYDALCHTFGTLATGGFSTKSASVGHFRSVPVELVIMFFMFLAATNFSLHFRFLRGERHAYLRDSEWRAYTGILFLSILFVWINLLASGTFSSLGEALRGASFQTVSIMTTTGFTTHDFNTWDNGSKFALVVLMFIGGCSGSTGGGIKVMRVVILGKIARAHLEKVYSPRTVRMVRLGKIAIDEEVQKATLAYLAIFVGVFLISCVMLTIMTTDLVTGVTAVAATFNNIGPGLEKVGAIEHYAHLPHLGKLILSLCMIMGRLEIFSILVLFIPVFWRQH
jgi:trk system potassium uptake protein TrkH